MSTTELAYNGRALDPEPINITLDELVERLGAHETCVAVLEPGDATRYRLLLTWAPALKPLGATSHFGIQGVSARRYMLAVSLDGRGRNRPAGHAWVPLDGDVGVWHTAELERNEWSQQLLAWWLTRLVERWREDVDDA